MRSRPTPPLSQIQTRDTSPGGCGDRGRRRLPGGPEVSWPSARGGAVDGAFSEAGQLSLQLAGFLL
jgi:hypothetical protein